MAGKLKLKFFGGVGSVTGANFMLQSDETKILVDCGLIQGPKWAREKNYEPFAYDPATVDILFVTHAHADHIGRIPKLVKDGFNGKIYSTKATKDLVRYMFEDAVKVLSIDAKKDNQDPLYNTDDVLKTLSLWEGVSYHDPVKIADFEAIFKDAGHILGSAMVEFKYLGTGEKIVFTGDLGNSPTPLLKDTEDITDADYLIMESVYGDRNHEGKEKRADNLKKAITRVVERSGTLVIPVFSLEKTQLLLHELNDLIEKEDLPSVPVYFDSPLAIRLTEVYRKEYENYNEHVKEEIDGGDDVFDFPKLKITMHNRESEEIHGVEGPKIIISASGMSEGGRVLKHEEHYLPDPKNAILFIGYQVAGSLGRAIKDGMKKVRIGGNDVPINAEIITIDGYSSHKDSDHLLEFVYNTAETLKKVFVVMGESKSSLFLVQKLRDNLDIDAVHPEEGEVVELG
ncbi:MAG: metallo-beta-lactamase family protein [Candidatus Paceibacteria bacterium]|jgi:metallo-beta-lactamase family protein